MMFQAILHDIKQAVGGRLVVTTAELEAIMGVSVGQQANLRSEGRFPIPHKKVGNKVHYSVHAVASHLNESASQHAKSVIKQEQIERDEPMTRLEKKTRGNHLKGNWWLEFKPRLVAIFEKREFETKSIAPAAAIVSSKTGI